MSQKGTDPNASETNEGDLPQAPPPSYDSNVNKSQYAPPSGPPPGQSTFHQAQSADGSSSGPYQYPEQQQQQQTFAAPPSGVYSSPPGGYAPPTGAYAPPAAGTYILPQPAPGHTQTVVYVVDEPMMMEHPGIPVAMICFIFGLCTWVGYLFGMCFIRSPDPRERWWARMCCIMCILWGLIIIFASIFH